MCLRVIYLGLVLVHVLRDKALKLTIARNISVSFTSTVLNYILPLISFYITNKILITALNYSTL